MYSTVSWSIVQLPVRSNSQLISNKSGLERAGCGYGGEPGGCTVGWVRACAAARTSPPSYIRGIYISILISFLTDASIAISARAARAPGGGGARYLYLAPADDLSGVVADTHAADVAARSTAADRGRRSY